MYNRNIKKFEEYTQDPLMDDLDEIGAIDDTPDNFDPDEWEIDEIIDILDEDPSKSEKDRIGDIDEAITFQTSVPKDIKRGDYIWITALIKRKGTSYNDPGRQAVIKLRVVDLYYGLSHLNKVINQ